MNPFFKSAFSFDCVLNRSESYVYSEAKESYPNQTLSHKIIPDLEVGHEFSQRDQVIRNDDHEDFIEQLHLVFDYFNHGLHNPSYRNHKEGLDHHTENTQHRLVLLENQNIRQPKFATH